MADLKKITKLREHVDQLQREADKAQGALDSVIERLRREFKCDSLEEAEALLKETLGNLEGVEEKYRKALRRFERKWGDVLQ